LKDPKKKKPAVVSSVDPWMSRWLQTQLPKPDATSVRVPQLPSQRAVKALGTERKLPVPLGEGRGVGTPSGDVGPVGRAAMSFAPVTGDLEFAGEIADRLGAGKLREALGLGMMAAAPFGKPGRKAAKKVASRVAELEAKYGTDAALGVRFDEAEGMSLLPNGKPAATCTNCADFIRNKEPNTAIFGFHHEDNPGAQVSANAGGHDFALVDNRYIVDPWIKETEGLSDRSVFDLKDPKDAEIISRFYGDRKRWQQVDPQSPPPLRTPQSRRRAELVEDNEVISPFADPDAREIMFELEDGSRVMVSGRGVPGGDTFTVDEIASWSGKKPGVSGLREILRKLQEETGARIVRGGDDMSPEQLARALAWEPRSPKKESSAQRWLQEERDRPNDLWETKGDSVTAAGNSIKVFRGTPKGVADPFRANAMGVTFVTPNEMYARNFAWPGDVHQAELAAGANIFDPKNPEHLKRIGASADDQLDHFFNLENPDVLKRIRDAGFDGAQVSDAAGETPNIALFNRGLLREGGVVPPPPAKPSKGKKSRRDQWLEERTRPKDWWETKGDSVTAAGNSIKDILKGGRYAILTAENAGGRAMGVPENSQRMSSLRSELIRRGYKPGEDFIPVAGRYQDQQTGEVLSENSFIIRNMPEREAKLVGRRYGQTSVMTQAGYHDLGSGQLFPSKGLNPEAKELPFSEGGGVKFDLQPDFERPVAAKVSALPVPKNANPEAGRLVDELRADMPNPPQPLRRVKAVDPEKGALMANAFSLLPENPEGAREAYDALAQEVEQQFKAIQDAGYKIEFVDEDPYKNSAELFKDINENRTLKVLKTNDSTKHPVLSNEQNDRFRAVHDFIAHAGGGNQFGPLGEENAYRIHASTLSPLAQRALAVETRGQNSWVNFGPNAKLPVGERPFAQQKASLWPESLLGEYQDMPPAVGIERRAIFNNDVGGEVGQTTFAVPAGQVRLTYENLNPSQLGTSQIELADAAGVPMEWDEARGLVGPGAVRSIYRQMAAQFPGAEATGGLRVTGANRNRVAERPLAQAKLTDAERKSAPIYTNRPQPRGGSDAERLAALGGESSNATTGLPMLDTSEPMGAPAIGRSTPEWATGNRLFDYGRLGEDVIPQPQEGLERALPRNPTGFANYANAVEQVSENLRSPENVRRFEAGLAEGGEKWYYMDPLARAFVDRHGEDEGLRRFTLLTNIIGATSPNSIVDPNIRRAGALFPHALAGETFEGVNLNDVLAPSLGNTAHNAYRSMLGRVQRGEPYLAKQVEKADSFAPNLRGNFTPLTADRHFFRRAFLDESRQGGSAMEYLGAEDATQEYARLLAQRGDLGVAAGRDATAPYQSALWIGDALGVGSMVKSPPVPALRSFEDEITRTAEMLGISRTRALDRFMDGSLWEFAGGAPGLMPRRK
jgi:hypothetical protein